MLIHLPPRFGGPFHDFEIGRRVRDADRLGLQRVEHVELLCQQHFKVDLIIPVQQRTELVYLPVIELTERLLSVELILDDEISGKLWILLEDHVVQELDKVCIV